MRYRSAVDRIDVVNLPPQIDAQLQSAYQSGNLGQALQLAEQVLQHDPAHPEANLTKAKVRYRQGLHNDAEAAARAALDARPEHAPTMVLLADIEGRRGRTSLAMEWNDRILAADPGAVTALYQRAILLERSGDWSAALEALDRPELALPDPHRQLLRARCQHASGETDAAITTLDDALGTWGMDSPRNVPLRTRLLLMRAKCLDAVGRYEEAFADARTANELVPSGFNAEAFEAQVDQIIELFTVERCAAGDGPLRHVFIAGMPRSGTTLVEQILDAHPSATGVGEAKEFMAYASNLQKMLGAWAPFPACIDGLNAEARDQLASRYESDLAQHGFDIPGLAVNKNLANLKLAGFIAMVLPDARFIFTTRDPRDTGISCFMGNFSSRLHPELQDIGHIALAIQQHERLRNHWKTVLGDRWIEVGYEDLVADQENRTRSLLEFCGLPWDERCLRFHENERTVMTLSYDQVNKPMYASSTGRYRNYESHIGPLLELVED